MNSAFIVLYRLWQLGGYGSTNVWKLFVRAIGVASQTDKSWNEFQQTYGQDVNYTYQLLLKKM